MIQKRTALIGLGVALLAIFALWLIASDGPRDYFDYICFAYRQYTYKPVPTEIWEFECAQDGTHVFYIEEWSTGIDLCVFKLFYAPLNQKNKKKIYESESGHLDSLEISSTGKYIMFKDVGPSKLVILNAKTFKKVREVNFSPPFPLNSERYPIDNKISYTDRDGIYLFDPSTPEKELLVKGDYRGLSWFSDGRLLVYTTEKSRFDGNSLLLYDYNRKKPKTILNEPTGLFEHAIVDSQNKVVYYALTNKKDNSAEISSVNLETLQKEVLWSQKMKYPDEPIHVQKLILAPDSKSLIFNTIASDVDKDKGDGIYILRLTDGRLRKILSINERPWDYSLKTNKIIWYDSKTKTFKEKEVKW